MTYTKINFTDENPASSPIKYKITDDSAGVVAGSAKIEVVTTVTPGTDLNASNLNHMDQGIYDADAAAATAQVAAESAQAAAESAQDTADEALAIAQAAGSGGYVGGTTVSSCALGTSLGDLAWYNAFALTDTAKWIVWLSGYIEDVSGGATVTIHAMIGTGSDYSEIKCSGGAAGSYTPFSMFFVKESGLPAHTNTRISGQAKKEAGDGTVNIKNVSLMSIILG